MLTNARQNRQVSACLQTNCCRLVYTLIAVGRVSADPLRNLTVSQNSALLKTPNHRSKVRCWQSNPLSKVHESKIGYSEKIQYEGCRKRCRRKDPLRKLDCLPKIWLYYKIQIQGRKCVVGKVYPLSKLHESKIGYSEKLQYEGCRKRCRLRSPRRKLDCLPKFGSTNISKSQVERASSARSIH